MGGKWAIPFSLEALSWNKSGDRIQNGLAWDEHPYLCLVRPGRLTQAASLLQLWCKLAPILACQWQPILVLLLAARLGWLLKQFPTTSQGLPKPALGLLSLPPIHCTGQQGLLASTRAKPASGWLCLIGALAPFESDWLSPAPDSVLPESTMPGMVAWSDIASAQDCEQSVLGLHKMRESVIVSSHFIKFFCPSGQYWFMPAVSVLKRTATTTQQPVTND